jgi:hypothetical protein
MSVFWWKTLDTPREINVLGTYMYRTKKSQLLMIGKLITTTTTNINNHAHYSEDIQMKPWKY